MGKDSAIAWTDHTFSPWWGCTKVAAGCKNCYAEKLAARFGTHWGPTAERRRFGDKHWRDPLAWDRAAEKAGKRARVFCGSMCDVFEDRCDLVAERKRLWDLIERTPNLDWLLLTKRPEHAECMMPWPRPMPNVWLGATVCTQEDADRNVPELLATPAAVRFLSVEPLLEAVRIDDIDNHRGGSLKPLVGLNWVATARGLELSPKEVGPKIDWVIVGGESGPNARPCHVEWIRSIVQQCRTAGTACFVKQLGARYEDTLNGVGGAMSVCPDTVPSIRKLRDRAGADPAEWPDDLRVRQMPETLKGRP